MKRILRNLVFFILLGLTAAVPVLVNRVKCEAADSSAEIIFDYAALNDYARYNGVDIDSVLQWCRSCGASGVAVEEMGREYLAVNGLARTVTYFDILEMQAQNLLDASVKPDPMCAYYLAKDSSTAQQICRGALLSLGDDRASVLPDSSGRLVELKCDSRAVVNLGLGIPVNIIERLHKKYGFKVWIRPWNSANLNESGVKSLIDVYGKLCSENKIEGIIFGGIRNEVYGYPNSIDYTAELLKNTKLKLGVIELAPKAQQKGIISLAKQMNDRVVRVMAVSSVHQSKLEPDTLVSMYSLGIRERGMRLIYCRPYFDGVNKLSASEANAAFMGSLSTEIAPYFKGGAGCLSSDGMLEFKSGINWPNIALLLAALSEACAVNMLFGLLKWFPYKKTYLLIPLMALAALICAFTGAGLKFAHLILALTAVTVFPVLGFVLTMPIWDRSGDESAVGSSLADGFIVFISSSLLSLFGGVLAAALLSETNYMLSLEVFRGVKLHSMAVPAIIFTIWLVMQHKRGGLEGVKQFLNLNVKVWHVALFSVLLAAGAFYLIRTGNSGGDFVVSDSERLFRRWLDTVLGVRPRFKEFLLGNPALILLPALVSLRWRGLVPFAVIAGGIGMASLSDTYAHIHTPFLISLHRTFNGALIGSVIGIIAVFAAFSLKSIFCSAADKYFKASEARSEECGGQENA